MSSSWKNGRGSDGSRVKPLSRRKFLRGFGGVTLGLPFLEALAPRGLRAAEASAIKRFGVFFCCNGVNMERWFPWQDFRSLDPRSLAGTANEPLSPHAGKLLYPRGVHMTPRGYGRDDGGGDDHGKGMAHKLTAYPATEDNWLATGPSIDQVIASQINPGEEGSRRSPLTLSVGRPSLYRGFDYISYTLEGRPVAGINNPWHAYAQFINLNAGGTDSAAARDRLTLRRQSVLDLVSDQFDDLKRAGLSSADRQKLDAHFTAVRSVEVSAGELAGALGCRDADLETRARAYENATVRDVQRDADFPTIVDLQIDVMALALACDYTRVATLLLGRGSGGPTYTWDGMNHEYNHHKLSHGKVRDDCFGESTADGCLNVPGFEDMLFDIDRYHQAKFARLLDRLDGYTEEDGKSVLDNSVMLCTNELSDGKAHSFMDLPYVLAGSAGGYLRQGEYVLLGDASRLSADDQTAPHNKLLNTLVNAMGIQSDWFGLPEGQGGDTMQGGVYESLLA